MATNDAVKVLTLADVERLPGLTAKLVGKSVLVATVTDLADAKLSCDEMAARLESMTRSRDAADKAFEESQRKLAVMETEQAELIARIETAAKDARLVADERDLETEALETVLNKVHDLEEQLKNAAAENTQGWRARSEAELKALSIDVNMWRGRAEEWRDTADDLRVELESVKAQSLKRTQEYARKTLELNQRLTSTEKELDATGRHLADIRSALGLGPTVAPELLAPEVTRQLDGQARQRHEALESLSELRSQVRNAAGLESPVVDQTIVSKIQAIRSNLDKTTKANEELWKKLKETQAERDQLRSQIKTMEDRDATWDHIKALRSERNAALKSLEDIEKICERH